MICSACGGEKATAHFGREPGRLGGRSSRCKSCIAENAKLSIRTSKQLPALVADVKRWPTAKIKSEIEWLEQKLEVLCAELRRR